MNNGYSWISTAFTLANLFLYVSCAGLENEQRNPSKRDTVFLQPLHNGQYLPPIPVRFGPNFQNNFNFDQSSYSSKENGETDNSDSSSDYQNSWVPLRSSNGDETLRKEVYVHPLPFNKDFIVTAAPELATRQLKNTFDIPLKKSIRVTNPKIQTTGIIKDVSSEERNYDGPPQLFGGTTSHQSSVLRNEPFKESTVQSVLNFTVSEDGWKPRRFFTPPPPRFPKVTSMDSSFSRYIIPPKVHKQLNFSDVVFGNIEPYKFIKPNISLLNFPNGTAREVLSFTPEDVSSKHIKEDDISDFFFENTGRKYKNGEYLSSQVFFEQPFGKPKEQTPEMKKENNRLFPPHTSTNKFNFDSVKYISSEEQNAKSKPIDTFSISFNNKNIMTQSNKDQDKFTRTGTNNNDRQTKTPNAGHPDSTTESSMQPPKEGIGVKYFSTVIPFRKLSAETHEKDISGTNKKLNVPRLDQTVRDTSTKHVGLQVSSKQDQKRIENITRHFEFDDDIKSQTLKPNSEDFSSLQKAKPLDSQEESKSKMIPTIPTFEEDNEYQKEQKVNPFLSKIPLSKIPFYVNSNPGEIYNSREVYFPPTLPKDYKAPENKQPEISKEKENFPETSISHKSTNILKNPFASGNEENQNANDIIGESRETSYNTPQDFSNFILRTPSPPQVITVLFDRSNIEYSTEDAVVPKRTDNRSNRTQNFILQRKPALQPDSSGTLRPRKPKIRITTGMLAGILIAALVFLGFLTGTMVYAFHQWKFGKKRSKSDRQKKRATGYTPEYLDENFAGNTYIHNNIFLPTPQNLEERSHVDPDSDSTVHSDPAIPSPEEAGPSGHIRPHSEQDREDEDDD